MSWEDREQQELQLDEGRSLVSYPDTAKPPNWTIGVGHKLGRDAQFANVVWTDNQVDDAFEMDFNTVANGCQSNIYVFPGLDGPRQGVLVNMAFNMGVSTLSTFHTFLDLLDQGKYDDAADDLLITAYAKQVPNRAQRLAYRIRTGQYANRS